MTVFSRILTAVALGMSLDFLVGDPHWFYHPVRLIGLLISGLENALRKIFPKTKTGERIAGGILAGLVPGITLAVVIFLDRLAFRIHPAVGVIVDVLLTCMCLAGKSLHDETIKVYDELMKGDLPAARKAVSMVVGRDTENLSAAGVTKAAVETVAENASDGVLAPLFYVCIGGPVLGWIYKSINTMDSMIAYKNERYRYFGTVAARLDDAANFIPSRLCALLMVASCAWIGLDAKNAFRIFKRDRYNHASPNSAQTESVMAGALNVQLAGDAYYFKKLVRKKTIGDDTRDIVPEDIRRANRLMFATEILSAIVFLAIRFLIFHFAGV